MTTELDQLDPNYVIAFDYSEDNVAKLVSELESSGLRTITRPGNNSRTVYAFTKVDDSDIAEGGKDNKGERKRLTNEKSSPIASPSPGSVTRDVSDDDKEFKSKQEGVLKKGQEVIGKEFNKDDIIKAGKKVLDDNKGQLAKAGEEAVKGDTSGLKSTGKDVTKDVAAKVEKNQAKNQAKSLIASVSKDDKSGLKSAGKNATEDIAKKVESRNLTAINRVNGKDLNGGAQIEKANEYIHDVSKSNVASDGLSSPNSVKGDSATLYAIVSHFDFIQSVIPIYDAERRKELGATVNNLIRSPTLIPSDHDLINLERLTRNPREILYFCYFKNYITWLLPISLIGVACRLLCGAVHSWEFNVTFASLLIGWSLLFTSVWVYYLEPLYVSRLGKVLGVIAPSGRKLSPPHVVLYKKLVFLPIALLFAASLIFCQFFCFFIEIFVTQLYSGPFGPVLTLLPTVLISGITPILTLIYNKLFVDPLVNWENGPNPKKSKAEKNYILTFLISYVPLFITLFVYLPFGYRFTRDLQVAVGTYAGKYNIPVITSEFVIDVNRYKNQFFFYTVTGQVIAIAVDNVVPLILDIVIPFLQKDGSTSQADSVTKIYSVIQAHYPRDVKLWKKVQSIHDSNYGEFDVDQNSSKLVIQFGYIAMFSIIWPLAPLIFAIFDLIIFRADLWRAFIKSKPSSDPYNLQIVSHGANRVHVSSSPWNSILEKTSYFGSAVSVALLLMYRYSNLPGVGLPTKLEKRDTWFKESPLTYSWSNILLIAIVVEHLTLLGHLYLKDILVSYRTKFEQTTLPSVAAESDSIPDSDVDEIAAVMKEIAKEEVEPKNVESQQSRGNGSDNLANTSNDTYTQVKTSGYKERADNSIYRNTSSNDSNDDSSLSKVKYRGRETTRENGYRGDDVTNGGGNNSSAKIDGTAHKGGSSIPDNDSSSTKSPKLKKTNHVGNEKTSKESGRHNNNSAKETTLSTQENGKRPSVPRLVTDSGSRETQLQAQGKNESVLTPASKTASTRNSRVFDLAGNGTSGAAGPLHSDADSFSHQYINNREPSFLDSPLSGDDAGATLPDLIPTSKNYHFRYDKNGNPLRFPSEISLNDSGSDITSGVGGLSAGIANESGKFSKEFNRVGKDLQRKNASNLKSAKSNGISAKKDVQKDAQKENGFPRHGGRSSIDRKKVDSGSLRDASLRGRSSAKEFSLEMPKTLDPAVIGSDANRKGPSAAPQNVNDVARQGSAIANAKGGHAKGAKGLNSESSNKTPKSASQGETSRDHVVSDKENATNSGYRDGTGADPESPAAQQFSRDVHSFKSVGTFGTAQSRFEKLIDVADHSEGGAEPSTPGGAQKAPQSSSSSKAKKEHVHSKGDSSKTNTPSRSKTVNKKETSSKNDDAAETGKKDLKQGSSNPELKANHSNAGPEGKGKHKNRFLHKIIKKLE